MSLQIARDTLPPRLVKWRGKVVGQVEQRHDVERRYYLQEWRFCPAPDGPLQETFTSPSWPDFRSELMRRLRAAEQKGRGK